MKPEPKHDIRESFLLFYIMISGMSVGQSISTTRHMIENGYDKNTIIALILWMALCTHSGVRIYQIYRQKKNNNKHQR